MHTKNVSGIYALCCPSTGEVRYIGQSKNIAARYSAHKRERARTPKARWMADLRAAGKTPKLEVLEETKALDGAEKEWIGLYKKKGARLLNLHMGGKWENVADPKPWRVAGVSWPTKLYMIRCRNIGVDVSFVREAVKSASTEKERMRLESRFAQMLLDTDLAEKMKIWIEAVRPSVYDRFPELTSG